VSIMLQMQQEEEAMEALAAATVAVMATVVEIQAVAMAAKRTIPFHVAILNASYVGRRDTSCRSVTRGLIGSFLVKRRRHLWPLPPTADTNWYADSGATDHITSDLEKLSIHDKYMGNDQVDTARGLGMRIQHVGNSTLHTPSRDLVLKNVLHLPDANKNVISIHSLARDNHVFPELHPWYFLIKDQDCGESCIKARLRVVFILSSHSSASKFLARSRCPMRGGIIA
jgi:hypothetical protein